MRGKEAKAKLLAELEPLVSDKKGPVYRKWKDGGYMGRQVVSNEDAAPVVDPLFAFKRFKIRGASFEIVNSWIAIHTFWRRVKAMPTRYFV